QQPDPQHGRAVFERVRLVDVEPGEDGRQAADDAERHQHAEMAARRQLRMRQSRENQADVAQEQRGENGQAVAEIGPRGPDESVHAPSPAFSSPGSWYG